MWIHCWKCGFVNTVCVGEEPTSIPTCIDTDQLCSGQNSWQVSREWCVQNDSKSGLIVSEYRVCFPWNCFVLGPAQDRMNTRWREEHLDQSGWKWRGSDEKWRMSSCIITNFYKIPLPWSNQGRWDGSSK